MMRAIICAIRLRDAAFAAPLMPCSRLRFETPCRHTPWLIPEPFRRYAFADYAADARHDALLYSPMICRRHFAFIIDDGAISLFFAIDAIDAARHERAARYAMPYADTMLKRHAAADAADDADFHFRTRLSWSHAAAAYWPC